MAKSPFQTWKDEIDVHDDQAMAYWKQQFLECFGTPTGRNVLAFLCTEVGRVVGRIDTEEERLHHNYSCTILEIMGYGDTASQYEFMQSIMDLPSR